MGKISKRALLKQKVAEIKKRAAHFIKFNHNMVGNFFDAYYLNELVSDEIYNDLGASFTAFERKGKSIIKTATKKGEEKLINEINWYLLFKNTDFAKFLPEIINYSTSPGNVFLEMHYYNYPNLRKIILEDMNAGFFLNKRWEYLLTSLSDLLFIEKNSIETPEDFVIKTHFRKLSNRVMETIRVAPSLKPVIRSNFLIINEKKYLNIGILTPHLLSNEKILAMLKPNRVYFSHGDLHSNNILCGIMHNKIILIDCRGQSPYGDLYFDVAYDIGKLYHDLRSLYTFIEKHYYSIFLNINHDKVEIDFEFNHRNYISRYEASLEVVEKILSTEYKRFGNLKYRAEFAEAMHYLTMVPFHLKSKSEGLMCYIMGIIRLNEWLSKYHPELYSELFDLYK